jgi:alcohol dehydrogenase, propanol-preferring
VLIDRLFRSEAPCLAGVDVLCQGGKVSGYYTPGTFQQYAIGAANYVTPIPDGIDSAAAAPILCAGVTVYVALKKVRAQAGDWVVISGAGGGLGHLATQYASRAMGFRVIAIDHGAKEAIVKECGAEHFVDLAAFPGDDGGAAIAAHVKQLTDGLGAHAVVVCTAANVAYAQSISFLRFNGTVVCVGMPEGDLAPIANSAPLQMIAGQYTITGSTVGNRRDAIEALQFLARGIIKVHYETKKLEDLTETFERIHRGDLHGRVVLDLS